MRTLHIETVSYPIRGVFNISRGSKTHAHAVIVTIEQDGKFGRAECIPYARYGETIKNVIALIENNRSNIENIDFTRYDLQKKMVAGAARNAVDCALFLLEARLKQINTWQLAKLASAMKNVITAYTISLDTPTIMAEKAEIAAKKYSLLKIKLGSANDEKRIEEIRKAIGKNIRIIIDANEGWITNNINSLINCAKYYDVEMIEQPLPADSDDILKELRKKSQPRVLLCADESFHEYDDLRSIAEKYDMINIKLDKTGGITEALRIVNKAKEINLKIMVGCMLGSSLSMAPAMLIAQHADIVDLDAPLLLKTDQPHPLKYNGNVIYPPKADLWG